MRYWHKCCHLRRYNPESYSKEINGRSAGETAAETSSKSWLPFIPPTHQNVRTYDVLSPGYPSELLGFGQGRRRGETSWTTPPLTLPLSLPCGPLAPPVREKGGYWSHFPGCGGS